jgi:hypothetical protein
MIKKTIRNRQKGSLKKILAPLIQLLSVANLMLGVAEKIKLLLPVIKWVIVLIWSTIIGIF